MVLIPKDKPGEDVNDNNVVWSADGSGWRSNACHAHFRGTDLTHYVENYTDNMRPHQLKLRERVWGYLFDPVKTPYPDIVEYLRSTDELFTDELLKEGYIAFNPLDAIETFGLLYFRSFLTHLRTPREHKNNYFRPPINENWYVQCWDITMDIFDHSHTGFMLAQRVGNSARWHGKVLYLGTTSHDTTGFITPARVRHSMKEPPNKSAGSTSNIFFGQNGHENWCGLDENDLGGQTLADTKKRAKVLREVLTQLKELATK
jgi:hypothetical protein